jgi:hypothetical protein
MDGYIIAGHNEAPWAVADTIPREKFPPTKWTDVVAVQWNQHVPAGSNLRRVYRSNVAYPQSKRLIESALEKIGKSADLDELPLWPGVDFEPGDHPTVIPMEPATEAFMGLLGCSHAAGPAYLGIQYRAIFGKKRINKIKVWHAPDVPAPNMLLYFEDL